MQYPFHQLVLVKHLFMDLRVFCFEIISILLDICLIRVHNNI